MFKTENRAVCVEWFALFENFNDYNEIYRKKII